MGGIASKEDATITVAVTFKRVSNEVRGMQFTVITLNYTTLQILVRSTVIVFIFAGTKVCAVLQFSTYSRVLKFEVL